MHQATHANLHQGNFDRRQTLGDARPPLADRYLPHVPVRLRTAANSSPVIAGISEDNPARWALMQCTMQIGSAKRQETEPSICQSKAQILDLSARVHQPGGDDDVLVRVCPVCSQHSCSLGQAVYFVALHHPLRAWSCSRRTSAVWRMHITTWSGWDCFQASKIPYTVRNSASLPVCTAAAARTAIPCSPCTMSSSRSAAAEKLLHAVQGLQQQLFRFLRLSHRALHHACADHIFGSQRRVGCIHLGNAQVSPLPTRNAMLKVAAQGSQW